MVLAASLLICSAASAGGGNSDNAKLCQKDGWTHLTRTDSTSFSNQGDCVSYAAKGGVLVSRRVQLVAIRVTPVNATVPAGRSQQFTAFGTYSDGSVSDLTGTVTWGSSNRTVATIVNASGSSGLAFGRVPGTTQISAVQDGVVGVTTFTVT